MQAKQEHLLVVALTQKLLFLELPSLRFRNGFVKISFSIRNSLTLLSQLNKFCTLFASGRGSGLLGLLIVFPAIEEVSPYAQRFRRFRCLITCYYCSLLAGCSR